MARLGFAYLHCLLQFNAVLLNDFAPKRSLIDHPLKRTGDTVRDFFADGRSVGDLTKPFRACHGQQPKVAGFHHPAIVSRYNNYLVWYRQI
jgi:hypothetical protein